MIITYNDSTMLEVWREGAGLEPPTSEASIERFDALSVNSRLRAAMRSWYVDYLATAPVDMVPVTDLTDYARIVTTPGADTSTLLLACRTTRLTHIELDGHGPVAIVNPGDAAHADLVHRLKNRFIRRGGTPVALYRPGDDRVTICHHADFTPKLAVLRGVEETDDTTYRIDERVLRDIPSLARQALSF